MPGFGFSQSGPQLPPLGSVFRKENFHSWDPVFRLHPENFRSCNLRRGSERPDQEPVCSWSAENGRQPRARPAIPGEASDSTGIGPERPLAPATGSPGRPRSPHPSFVPPFPGAKRGSREALSLRRRSASGDSGETAAGKEPNAAEDVPRAQPSTSAAVGSPERPKQRVSAGLSGEPQASEGRGRSEDCDLRQAMAADSGGTRQRNDGIARESLGRQPWLSGEAETADPFRSLR